MRQYYFLGVLLLCGTLAGSRADTINSVGILSTISKYEQIVTSSTLRWIDSSKDKVPENAVEGATIRTVKENDEVLTPVWLCRTRTNGMWLPGSLTEDSGKCIVSNHGTTTKHASYEILQNNEDGGKLAWIKWDKYSLPPGGSVSVGSDSLMYIARRKPSDPTSELDFNVGRLDRTSGLLGKIFVVEDGAEKEYEDGEILVETEPVRYEMEKVNMNKWRAKYQRENVVLGSTILRNEDIPEENGDKNDFSRVDTVIAYFHNSTTSWGHGHAMLAGFPVVVTWENGTEMDNFIWATDSARKHESIYPVEGFLSPGQGVNVTLVANWTESNIPYSAKVTAFYPDGSKKSRKILGSRREVGLRDTHAEFGPVYWLHNNSHVPTTTTTTTTTSTTTFRTTSAASSSTSRTSTSTEEAKPIPASPMEELNSTTKKSDVVDRKKENQSMLADGPKSDTSVAGKSGQDRIQLSGITLFCLSSVLLVLSSRT